jgi:predicted deacylase
VVSCLAGTPLPRDTTVLDSGIAGPKLVVIGGLHGDEPSGTQAATILIQGPRPKRGRLFILAKANPEAIAAGKRVAPHPNAQDLNRVFPGGGDTEEARRAASIFELAKDVDLVLDLHEEGSAWLEADLPTLVVSPASSAFAMDLLEALDAKGLHFAFTGGAPAGSLVGELGTRGRKALVMEVPARSSLEERIRMQLLVVEVALDRLDMR